jgi:hypothetical protein
MKKLFLFLMIIVGTVLCAQTIMKKPPMALLVACKMNAGGKVACDTLPIMKIIKKYDNCKCIVFQEWTSESIVEYCGSFIIIYAKDIDI